MQRSSHGLVVGKFYPPHAGHHLLVRAAAAVCDRVTVIVMASSVESIPLSDRVAWMREVHEREPQVHVVGTMDEHPVDYDDPHVWDLHQRLMQKALRVITDLPVTAVFTSEPYGAELARRFEAVCVPIDPERALVPCSGTAVRNDPIATWEWLASPVRRALARRVVVVGAESTGTTTLSRDLVHHLRARGGSHAATEWVPEYGRDYTIEKLALERARAALSGRGSVGMTDLVWTSPEFEAIARRQIEIEDEAAATGGPILVCDTDAFATGIWHERYLGVTSKAVEVLGDARDHALYLVTDHVGVPFVQDGIRDGAHAREWMTRRFLDALAGTGRRHLLLSGPREERLVRAAAAVDALLGQGWDLAAPLG